MTGLPHWFGEDSIKILPPASYDPATYQADVHMAGMAETLQLLHAERPGAALRRLARTVADEMACLGHHGLNIQVSDGMARLIAAKRNRQDRRVVAS